MWKTDRKGRDETEAGSPVRRELRWQAKDHMASAGAVATKGAHKLLCIHKLVNEM